MKNFISKFNVTDQNMDGNNLTDQKNKNAKGSNHNNEYAGQRFYFLTLNVC